ncbi:hypothetical protein [Sulfurimonas sp.]|uniref:hypothetical protein n=1 Tax=Sulfurimonas sp. TaxID=2022749 RepID=UPI00356A008B
MSSTNRGAVRNAHDFYATPQEPIELLLNELDLSKVSSFCEPCRGDNAILKHFAGVDRLDYAEIREGINYLEKDYEADLIVTNPPFSEALEFLEKSLNEAKTVVYLLRLNFLGSQKRKQFWNDNPPSHIFVLSKRPSFTGKGTDSTEYAWFCWDKSEVIKRDSGVYVL